MTKRIAVLTSGGDAQGMNAAVRAVVRFAIWHHADVFAVYEGYKGLIEGGEYIKQFSWDDVGGILHKGGTIIGSARCLEFKERWGRLTAAENLVKNGIDALIVCGGDGSLTGANLLRQEWSGLLHELAENGRITWEQRQQYEKLTIAGLTGSIDNDLCGTDMTIGADTALHRIVDAIDAISSTAASHQRTFVVEVMGRRCGYLALMGAIASGADWALIPESPPDMDNWEEKMCNVLRHGRELGRRDSIVVVAEGAQDRHGNPITSQYVKEVLEERMGERTRVTILGHVQRGGTPSVFDRNFSTLTGAEAVKAVLDPANEGEAFLVGIRANRITRIPLEESLAQTKEVAEAVKAHDFERAMTLRGESFKQAFNILRTLVRAEPHERDLNKRQLNIAVLNAGAPAPGMNTCVRAAVRLGMDHGHRVYAVRQGFKGLVKGDYEEFDWMSVNGWVAFGGSELGTSRYKPEGGDFYQIARNFEEHNIDGLIVIGGWAGYEAALDIYNYREEFPAFNIPITCIPATIDNDLPGSELSIGTDTALNCIVDALDKIRQSAGAANRVFVVEVMGRTCGYLALMSAMASGAERVYLPEEGVKLADLQRDVETLSNSFKTGRRLGLMIRNESASKTYDTQFMVKLFEEEGGELFDVRQAILGHLQQGGDPSPFDRVQGSRQALRCIEYIEEQSGKTYPRSACVGLVNNAAQFTDFDEMERLMDFKHARPKKQWWLELRPVAKVLAQPGRLDPNI